jgi:membrane-bound serine protease (ClpP class)
MRIEGPIAQPTLFVVRRGVKEAISAGADAVVLDMDTPGGGLAETLEIMEILDKFTESTKGRVITYVNREAGSAGAIIAAITDDIYFAPKSVIGAAEVVQSTGEDVNESMKRKITSFLAAKVRALSEENPLRGQVLQAMMDPTYELKVGDELIKAKDVLLTLTAFEAVKEYGEPPRPLFGTGIVDTLPGLYEKLAGGPGYEIRAFQMTWSIQLARWLTAISPILLGIGGLMLAIEFKTPGFGWIGATGIALLLVVFLGHNVAGLSGNEPMLVFLLGVVLVMLEMFLFPGTIIFAATGALLMLGSLLWGMADIWPGDFFKLTPGVFFKPAYTLSLGFLFAVVLFAAVARFLPKTSIWSRLVLSTEVSGSAGAPIEQGQVVAPGAEGVVVSPLRPTGTVEIAGRRYEARSEVGELDAGARIRVVRRADFVLVVENLPS